ncbi:butyrophilin subfamily 1 member A1-like [Hypomesus transpacificus]|uniref:butyrophilin subfamily 1 member A1-like n=1 Tax=Hypomesus transpacificus TaxID=137520 RepID=UPI001F081E41|nr:butyrophilin subfamily 1 member A1-like [Hypomesus transpacificus]
MAEAGQHNEFKLRVPERFVGADEGKDVTLSCHLSPETSAVAMTIRWFNETKCICLYKNGQVIEGRGYEGRVSLVTQELKKGNLSLRLRDYKHESVKGVYICQVTSGRQKEEDTVGLWNRALFAAIPELAEHYLQRESPGEKRSREESAWLLENQMDSKLLDQLLEDKQKKEKELEREINQRKELEKHLECFRHEKRVPEEKHKEIKTTERGEISEAEPKLTIRGRCSRDPPPKMGGESSSLVFLESLEPLDQCTNQGKLVWKKIK